MSRPSRFARAAERIQASEVADLDAIVCAGRDALAAGERGRAIRLSGGFHIRIAEIADQTVLEEFLRELVARSSLVIALYGHAGRSDCGDADHVDLLRALEQQDAAGAVALMTEHLHHIEADLDFGRQGASRRSARADLRTGSRIGYSAA